MIGPRALPPRALAISFTALFFLLLLSATSCVREADITLEQRAHQLSGELMCPVCDGQTIDGSNAQIAVDMRLKVRELLDAGDTNAEVRDYFVDRYGQEILAAPERSGFNLLAYIVPVVIVLGGIGIALITIKNMRKSASEAKSQSTRSASDSQQPDDIANYLAQVDRDLGISTDVNNPESSDVTSSQPEKENS
jgi:cytochrome c-type biogenesis protein CcmH